MLLGSKILADAGPEEVSRQVLAASDPATGPQPPHLLRSRRLRQLDEEGRPLCSRPRHPWRPCRV